MKICFICKEEKNLSEFRRDKSRKDGFHPYCKMCQKRIRREAYNSNPIVREGDKRRHTKYYQGLGKETIAKYHKIEKYPEICLRVREKRVKNGKLKLYHKYKYDNDIQFKIRHNLSCRMKEAIKRNSSSKRLSILNVLGCSIMEVRQHLESQFQEDMTWDNYGEWHIDHIIPCSYFNLSIEENQKICFHYLNLQPLWRKENCYIKKASIPKNVNEVLNLIKSKLI